MSAAHRPPIAADSAEARRALVLAGGGMRVAYQAGAVKALFDAGLRFTHADGSSGGTINLAALLSGVEPDDLCARWRSLSVLKFGAPLPASEYLHAYHLPALASASGMRDYVYPSLGVDMARLREARGIEATFNACRFDDKTVVPIHHTELDLDRLVAAASLPIFMPAVQTGGSTWTDAVWIMDCNLPACVAAGARELWLIWCIGNTPRYHDGWFDQYVHMIEMCTVGALNAQLAAIADINRRIAAGEAVAGHREPVTVYIVKPEVPLPLDPDFYFGRIDAATLIDMGYRDARRALRQSKAAPLDASASRMREPGVGISFRETMTGAISLVGSADAGGSGKSGEVRMHAAIHIEDVETFIASREHKAGLTGHIDFPPFGKAIPAESGVFGLFTPSDDVSLTYMIYELGFRHAGRSYYLAGKKHVRVGSCWKLWPQTTTLYCTVHEGIDATGKAIGSGTLRLGVRQLLGLLGSLHATNAHAPGASSHAVRRFFSFFASELFRTYVLRRPLAARAT